MPIFTRRRLQMMIDELGASIGISKIKDIRSRIENKRVEQALPAEMELALIWAVSKLGSCDVEPDSWPSNRRPDVVSSNVVHGKVSAIEIAAPTDISLNYEREMDDFSRIVGKIVDGEVRNISEYLYFKFGSESGYSDGEYFRRVLCPKNARLTDRSIATLKKWAKTSVANCGGIKIVQDGLDVTIERKDYKQTRWHNFWCSMPAETHSVEGNYLYQILKAKSSQVQNNIDVLRVVFLADVGSDLLRHIGSFSERDPTHRRVSGSEIIGSFLNGAPSKLDSVVVFSPHTQHSNMLEDGRRWKVTVFNRPDFQYDLSGIEKIAGVLPPPRFEGYQARSIFRQGAFSPEQRGWHLGMSLTVGHENCTVRVSSRLFLDLMAGRVSRDWFLSQLDCGGRSNIFAHWLNRGMTLSGVEMGERNIDDDDDCLILHFRDDPAARELTIPIDRK